MDMGHQEGNFTRAPLNKESIDNGTQEGGNDTNAGEVMISSNDTEVSMGLLESNNSKALVNKEAMVGMENGSQDRIGSNRITKNLMSSNNFPGQVEGDTTNVFQKPPDK